MSLYDKLATVTARGGQSAWATRIACELNFASSLSQVNDHAYDALIESAVDTLKAGMDAEGGVITKTLAEKVEEMLLPLSEDAKSYRVHCLAHAHIDMNWMWGFQETASVTVDTFRTVLDLMKEYPTLTFGQSQASTYQIIEEFAPDMLEEIKERIAEGRWEVTASTWVETDKNMTSGESLARHILYTRRYLSKLLDIPADSMNMDFEPDTFGHNVSIPEICTKGGVKYYYHWRGYDGEDIAYRWRARSGAELLVWREPVCYNYTVNGDMFRNIPQTCARHGLKSYLSVYGVGDHGGGPTRRDVDRLIEIAKWPIMPTVMFSTYGAFFRELEAYRETLPVHEGEINFVFTGCYTSQSRIKLANRIAEDRVYESEFLGAAANALADGPRYNSSFGKAWEQILFNHFHDILPGSGVVDTREYAMGQFQRAMAAIQTNANCAMRSLAAAIDTSSIEEIIEGDSSSQGSAVGFMSDHGNHYQMPRAERGLGKKRIFHLFNSTQYDFDGVVDLTVWDWNYDPALAVFATPDGEQTQHKLLANNQGYWGHQFKNFAVRVKVPALGYATYTLDRCERDVPAASLVANTHPMRDRYNDGDLVMENECVRAVFDHGTMQLISLIDKASGDDLVMLPTANFRLIRENTVHGMTSWRVGDYMTVENLNETQDVRVHDINLGGVRKWIRYDLPFGERSKLGVTVTLNDASKMLDFDITVDFHEICKGAYIPQLNFYAPVGYDVSNYRYDVPFGTLDRSEIAHDVPANSFGVALPAAGEDQKALMLISDSKYGFRGNENALALTLIRASCDPDPYPEYGIHRIRLGLGVVDSVENGVLYREAAKFVHPVATCSTRSGKGTLAMSGKLLTVNGDVRISAIKTPEDMDGLVVRLSDASGKGSAVELTFAKALTAAYDADINETVLNDLPFDGETVSTTVEPFGVKTVIVQF